ncbi:MAG: hypothetical protein KF784_10570 [Fimbriimonadaceae bacterium]|nr:hypothetical protein [Fimbriimonadaceae bacterium]
MADLKDMETAKYARREFVKHRIDITLCDLLVRHGVVYLRGVVQAERTAPYEDVREETLRIARLLRQIQGVRDVVVECQYKR